MIPTGAHMMIFADGASLGGYDRRARADRLRARVGAPLPAAVPAVPTWSERQAKAAASARARMAASSRRPAVAQTPRRVPIVASAQPVRSVAAPKPARSLPVFVTSHERRAAAADLRIRMDFAALRVARSQPALPAQSTRPIPRRAPIAASAARPVNGQRRAMDAVILRTRMASNARRFAATPPKSAQRGTPVAMAPRPAARRVAPSRVAR